MSFIGSDYLEKLIENISIKKEEGNETGNIP